MNDGEAFGPTAHLVGDAEIADALDAYVGRIQALLEDQSAGVYLYGSVVFGDYRPGTSDVDVLVLHRFDLGDEQRRNLAGLHKRAGRHAGADRLDVSFVPLRLVGTYGEDALPFSATAGSIGTAAATSTWSPGARCGSTGSRSAAHPRPRSSRP